MCPAALRPLLVKSVDVVAKKALWAANAERLRGTEARLDANESPEIRLLAARTLAEQGLVPVLPIVGEDSAALLDALLDAGRLARRHPVKVVGNARPWLQLDAPVEPSDARLSEVFYRALTHAELHRDQELRSALDARAGYRRLLADAPADEGDAFGLRWDLTHAPSPGTARLTIIATRNCQLRCEYCMVRLWNEDSEPRHVERAVDLLFSSPSPSVRMQFYGGEPLLREDMVRLGIEHGRRLERETGKQLAIVLITNGVKMTPEIAAWAKQRDVEVLLSFDGPREITNQGRIAWRGKKAYIPPDFDTYGAATAALRMLLDAGTRHHVIITLPPEHAASCAHAIDHVRGLGATTIQVCYAMGTYWGPEAIQVFCDQFERVLNDHGSAIDRGEWSWTNLFRREPLLVDTALQVETDGRICFMNECMFEKYKTERNYGIASVHDPVAMQSLGSEKFHNWYLLVRTYADRNPRWLEIMLDNIELGARLRDRLGSSRKLPIGGLT
jgi:hypothetical protein